MSIVGLPLNLLLAGLLVAALAMGWRLNRRLKALRDSHDGFAVAVAGAEHRPPPAPNRACPTFAPPPTRPSTSLADRIEKGRTLATRLDQPDRPRPAPRSASRSPHAPAGRSGGRASPGRIAAPPPGRAAAGTRRGGRAQRPGRTPHAPRARWSDQAPPPRRNVEEDLFDDEPPDPRRCPRSGPVKSMPRILPLVGIAVSAASWRSMPWPALATCPAMLAGYQGLRRGSRQADQDESRPKAATAKAKAAGPTTSKAADQVGRPDRPRHSGRLHPAAAAGKDAAGDRGPAAADPPAQEQPARQRYAELAKEAGLSPAELAGPSEPRPGAAPSFRPSARPTFRLSSLCWRLRKLKSTPSSRR